MTTIDIIILVVIAGGLARGLAVGAVRQITSIIGIVLAFALAIQLMQPVGLTLVERFGLSSSFVSVLGFATVFLGVQLVFFLLGQVVEHLVEALRLSPVNRAVGAVLGGFKAALLLSLAFLLLSQINLPARQTQQASMLYEPVAHVLPRTWAFAEEHVPSLRSLPSAFGDATGTEITSAHGAFEE